MRIRYVDEAGTQTLRDVQPRRLWISDKGHIALNAWDLLRADRRTFRTAHMTIQLEETPAMATVTLTKDAVTLYDIASRTVWRRMSHRDGEQEIALCRGLGDTIQEYDTTDRNGRPMRVVLQHDATGSQAGIDPGGIYEFAV